MRRIFFLIALLLLATAGASGQNSYTTVTAVVVDNSAAATPYALGTFNVTLLNTTGQQATFGGSASFQQVYSGQSLSATGAMSIVLPSTAVMSPPGLEWKFSICANPQQIASIFPLPPLPCFSFTSTGTLISGASVDISAQLKAVAATIPLAGGSGGGITNPITTGVTVGTGGSVSATGTGTITATTVAGYQGKLFNATDPAYGLSTSNTAAQNNTALTALSTAVNAYTPANPQDRPVVYIPGGNAGAAATYAYSGGLVFTQAMTLECGPGAMLNYTGSAHAADFGPTGLTFSGGTTNATTAQLTSQYIVNGCGWTGGASFTQGLFFNPMVFSPQVSYNMFYNFGPNASATAYAIYISINISDVAIGPRNQFINLDGVARNGVRVDDTSGFSDQAHIFQNSSYNGLSVSGVSVSNNVPTGVLFWVSGNGSLVDGNDLGFCAPCVRVGPGVGSGVVNGTRVVHNYMEGPQGTATIPLIQYGDPGSAVFVDSPFFLGNFMFTNGSAPCFGPSSATTGISNAMIANTRISGCALPLVVENNVAGQIGNSFWDVIGCSTGQCNPNQIVTVSGNVTPWGQPNYSLYLPDGTTAQAAMGFASTTGGGTPGDFGLRKRVDTASPSLELIGTPTGGSTVGFRVSSQTAGSNYVEFGLNVQPDAGTFPDSGFTVRHYLASVLAEDALLSNENNRAITFYTTTGGSRTKKLSILNAGQLSHIESAAPSGTAGSTILYPNSTDHTYHYNANNNGDSAFTGAWNCTNVTPVTVSANVSTDQNLMTCTVPAGTLNRVNRTLKIWLSGVFSTPAASTAVINVKIKLGALTLATYTSTALGGVAATNDQFNVTAYNTVQTAGATAAFEAHGVMVIDLGVGNTVADSSFADVNTATVSSVDTTASQTLQITIGFSTASASNTATQRQLIVETVN
jgi:hypothetical protein